MLTRAHGGGGRRSQKVRVAPGLPAAAALVAAALVAAACSGGEDGSDLRSAGTAASPTTTRDAPGCPEPFESATQQGDSVALDTGGFEVTVEVSPPRIEARDGEGPFFAESGAGGMYVVRDGARIGLEGLTPESVDRCAVVLMATFADGGRGRVSLTPHGGGTVEVGLALDEPGSVTAWGERIGSPRDELVYGLMERTVDDWLDSEVVPTEEGTLNVRGQRVTMWVRPTMSVYAPFFQTSSGYGLLVDGTMPGTYDLAAADPETLGFEFERAPGDDGGRFYLFHGPSHAEILDEYTRLVGRPPRVPDVVFTHWLGHDELPAAAPVELDGATLNAMLAADLAAYEAARIPPGIYHFDRPWAEGTEGYGALRFDPARFPDAEAMLALLHDRGWAAQVWASEWVLDERAAEAASNGYLAPGSDRVPDLTEPEAAAWFAEGFRSFLDGPEGRWVDGFFLDRTDEVVPSEFDDVYTDGRTGREVHNAYPVMMQRLLAQVVDDARGGDGWVIARAAYTGSSGVSMQWGGDTRSREGIPLPEQPDTGAPTDLGLRSAIVGMQRAAFLGLPYWGSDIGGYTEFASRDTYARWIEVGALSPLMRFHGKGHHVPWDMPTEPRRDEEMIAIYRRYVLLHHSLRDYLTGLAEEAHDRGTPIARPLVFEFPDDEGSLDRWDEWLLGPDLLVAPVWKEGARSRVVYIPPGRWVDFWDRDRRVTGPAVFDEQVPLDHIPLFVRSGSTLLDVAPS